MTPIGVFRCTAQYPYDVPRQGTLAGSNAGVVELSAGCGFEEALEGLAGFDRVWLLFVFDRNDGVWHPKVQPPRHVDHKIGVFAFRDCKKLASLQLQPPANVMGRKIGVGAFDGVPARTQSTGAEGLVCVVWEVKGSGAIAVPDTWAAKYPDFADAFGANLAQALVKPSGKRAADGSPMYVWQDYVAGTDPTDLNDVFKATISYVDGEPLVSWTPELPPEQAALRKYTIYGKAKLSDADWSVINGNASAYNFFKVTVEMK